MVSSTVARLRISNHNREVVCVCVCVCVSDTCTYGDVTVVPVTGVAGIAPGLLTEMTRIATVSLLQFGKPLHEAGRLLAPREAGNL